MLFDVFEWLCLYALINPTGPRVLLMYIMHVQLAHYFLFFYACMIFCCVQNGNNPISDYVMYARICYRFAHI